MEEVLYEFPVYTQKIIDKLIKTNWFIHPFELNNEYDIYDPAGYLYNTELNGLEYVIHLDLNVYQYVLSAFKKNILFLSLKYRTIVINVRSLYDKKLRPLELMHQATWSLFENKAPAAENLFASYI